MLQITETVTVKHHTVKDGNRVIGMLRGNDDDGYAADYFVPVYVGGVHYGQYMTKTAPFTGNLKSMIGWLSDQDGLYRDRPEDAMRYA